ncbi:MAG: hypothetical protein RMJ51_04435 [Candidatus Calescibacterium sp.]|nr:hypothetical protein [Candidatus Calescibacterium sp.]MCX7971949.1 hypothetical protein [bacterium]MDW8195465.1 hypothetical protein [Candidatus Calescibacterium sp.]
MSVEIEKIIDHIISEIDSNGIEYLDFEQKDQEKTTFKIKVIKKTKSVTNKNLSQKETKQREADKKIESKESFLEKESEDLGGFKLSFIDENKFYVFSTLVGKLNLDRRINIGQIIKAKQKIGEIEILNIKNPIVLDFSIKILDILCNLEDYVDYGKKIILAERIDNGIS